MQIKDYKIVTVVLKKELFQKKSKKDYFEQEIKELLSQGYQPYKKLLITKEQGTFKFSKSLFRFTQVMVKY